MTYSTYLNLPVRPALQPTHSDLEGPSGAAHDTKGTFTAESSYQDEPFSFTISVIDGPGDTNLLSRRESLRVGLIQRILAAVETPRLQR